MQAYLAYYEAKRLGYDPELIIDLCIMVHSAAVIGARLYYVIFEWSYYKGDIMKIINIREGGLAIPRSFDSCRYYRICIHKGKKDIFLEYCGYLCTEHNTGPGHRKVGNFVNQEVTEVRRDLPWAIIVDGVKVHRPFCMNPCGIYVFLYSCSSTEERRRGREKYSCYMGYCILWEGFWIEGLRTDSLMFMGMRQAQIISMVIIAASLP